MNQQLRLFVGIFPRKATQKLLNQKTKNLSQQLETEIRILTPEVLHLTIKFIGDVSATQLEDFKAAFLQAKGNLPCASLQIENFQLFPSRRKPRVLAAAVTRSPELDSIFQFFNRSFNHLGIVAEKRSFNPHITVGRSRCWQQETIFTAPIQLIEPITSVTLVHSQLTPQGAKYNIIASVGLPT
jgi:2'-5' RNA ligase